MPSNKRFVLVATDGNRAIRLVWLRVKSDGIYGSFFHRSVTMHRSYHLDGSVHFKAEGPMENVKDAERIFKAAKHPKSFVSLGEADHLVSRPQDARFLGHVLSAWAGYYVGSPD